MKTVPLNITPYASGLECPRCQSTKIVKNGTYKHRQNYICKDCQKALSTHTGTAISGIHKRERFMQYTQCLAEGLTIKQSAEHLGISISTSFAWRHKHLSALKPAKVDNMQKIKSLLTIKTPFSQKGSRNKINQTQPDTKSIICVDAKAQSSIRTFKSSHQLDSILYKLNDETAVIKPNSQLTYASQRQNIKKLTNKSMNVWHHKIAKELTTNLEDWLYKFRGVATKYLQRYWNWFCFQKESTSYQWCSLTDKTARLNYLQLFT